MTKGQLLEILKDVPLASDIKVYDFNANEYCQFSINTTDYFDYESQMPIAVIEINDESSYLSEHDSYVDHQTCQ